MKNYIFSENCTALTAPRYGGVTCDPPITEDNATCTFYCEVFYKLRGTSKLTCSEGSWNRTAPVCDATNVGKRVKCTFIHNN